LCLVFFRCFITGSHLHDFHFDGLRILIKSIKKSSFNSFLPDAKQIICVYVNLKERKTRILHTNFLGTNRLSTNQLQ
jgi:hypothetical protein